MAHSRPALLTPGVGELPVAGGQHVKAGLDRLVLSVERSAQDGEYGLALSQVQKDGFVFGGRTHLNILGEPDRPETTLSDASKHPAGPGVWIGYLHTAGNVHRDVRGRELDGFLFREHLALAHKSFIAFFKLKHLG